MDKLTSQKCLRAWLAFVSSIFWMGSVQAQEQAYNTSIFLLCSMSDHVTDGYSNRQQAFSEWVSTSITNPKALNLLRTLKKADKQTRAKVMLDAHKAVYLPKCKSWDDGSISTLLGRPRPLKRPKATVGSTTGASGQHKSRKVRAFNVVIRRAVIQMQKPDTGKAWDCCGVDEALSKRMRAQAELLTKAHLDERQKRAAWEAEHDENTEEEYEVSPELTQAMAVAGAAAMSEGLSGITAGVAAPDVTGEIVVTRSGMPIDGQRMLLDKIPNSYFPQWNARMANIPNDEAVNLEIRLHDADAMNDDPIGQVIIKADELRLAATLQGKPYSIPNQNKVITIDISVFPLAD